MLFTDPYSAWQRGTSENSKGLLREFYPKKTDLAKVAKDNLFKNRMKINLSPRKCLNWKIPFEVFQHKVLHLACQSIINNKYQIIEFVIRFLYESFTKG